ncbi:RNA-binding S4 domain-containing protein [Vibrio chagasii]|nr:RNA-binding S4 domain-containing protein [Vibrio chagasii]
MNLVSGGGVSQACYLPEGYVAVNGELETRKRRKMYDGTSNSNQEHYVVL